MILLSPVLLLLLALSGCFTEVVEDFTQTCSEFFVNPRGIRSLPTIFTEDNYKQICQIRDNNYEYATLYDTNNKIPVYSAYKFNKFIEQRCERNVPWFIEPQLEDLNDYYEYLLFPFDDERRKMASEDNAVQYNNQAVNDDYIGSGYDKGHLAPVYHAGSQSCADATFTLTNTAPQNKSFNRGQWKKTEKDVAQTLRTSCFRNLTYIVTGVVPGGSKIKNRVNIPSHFWMAYCCLDNNLRVIASRGFLGENRNTNVTGLPVEMLDARLTELYQRHFEVFDGNCYVSSTTPPSITRSSRKRKWHEISALRRSRKHSVCRLRQRAYIGQLS